MAKFSEEQLITMTKPASRSEEDKLINAESMARSAINSDPTLKSKNIEIFGQGSYKNNTNIRLNSDVDINIKYEDAFYYYIPNDKKEEDYGLDKLGKSSYSFSQFKDDVEEALAQSFGRNQVVRGNKCFTVKGNSYRMGMDVVPTFSYRRYLLNGNYIEGVVFFADDSNLKVVNYPKQHVENGIVKNNNTSRIFKRLTRVFKNIKIRMKEDIYFDNENISSFLLECLVWNVPNNIFNDYDNWNDRLSQSIVYLYNNTKGDSKCKEWGEVSDLLYLFTDNRKWKEKEVNEYLGEMWRYLEYYK